MTITLYQPDDYPTIDAWWKARGTTPTPENCLPRLGVIIRDHAGEAIFAAWVSMDNSCGIAFLLFPVSKPETPPSTIAASLSHTVGYFAEILKDLGYHTLLSGTHRHSLARSLESLGFTPPESVLFQTLAI